MDDDYGWWNVKRNVWTSWKNISMQSFIQMMSMCENNFYYYMNLVNKNYFVLGNSTQYFTMLRRHTINHK